MKRLIGLLIVLAVATSLGMAQSQETPKASFAWMGGEMLRSTASLAEVALSSNFFLEMADQLELTESQREGLSEIAYRGRSGSIEKTAEAQLAASEIRFLLSRPEINLAAVEAAVNKMHALRAELQMGRIRAALEAIAKLSHEQHRLALAAGKVSNQP